MSNATRIAISAIWAIAAAVVAFVNYADVSILLGMRVFWLSAPVVISAVAVYLAAPAIQAGFHRDDETTFLCLWVAVPVTSYVALSVILMGWFAVSGDFANAVAVPLFAFLAPNVFPIFPFSAAGASFFATVATVAILAAQRDSDTQVSD